jgi:hypothetical protein
MNDEYDHTIRLSGNEHSNTVWRLFGAADVLHSLKKAQEDYGNLSGLGMAIAVAEKEVAELRAQMAGGTMRIVQEHGFDITKHHEIVTTIDSGEAVIMLNNPKLI